MSTKISEMTPNPNPLVGDELIEITDPSGPTTFSETLAHVATLAAAGLVGDKGDITVSGSGATWTIDNDAVTYAKMQNVSATDKLLGRSTAGAGNLEEIPCTGFARSILDDADAAAVRATIGAGTGGGDASGPSSSTDGHVATFNGTTGKLIKDSGLTLSGTNTGDQTSVSGNAGTATALQTARTIGGTSFNGTADITQPFDVHAFYPGVPTASAKVMRMPIGRAVTFAANFAGSYFAASANATGTTVFDVQKNGSSIGSISIAASGTTATFTTTGGTAKTFSAGDVLSIIAPGSADATLADPGFVLAGTR